MVSSGHSGVPRNLRQRCRIFPGASWKAATALPGRNDGFVGTLLAPREVVTALSHLLGCFPEGGDSAAGAKGWFLRNSPGSPGSCDSAVASSRVSPGRQRQSCRSEVMVFRVLRAPQEVATALSHLPGCLPEGSPSAGGAKGWLFRIPWAPREVATALSHLPVCLSEDSDSAAGAKLWLLRDPPGPQEVATALSQCQPIFFKNVVRVTLV